MGNTFSHFFGRLLHTKVAERRCLSRVTDKIIRLDHEYVANAQEISITFTIQWPLLLFAWKPPALSFELLNFNGVPFPDSPRCTLKQGSGFRTTQVCITVPPEVGQSQQLLNVRVKRRRDSRRVGELVCHRVDIASIAKELSVNRIKLFTKLKGKQLDCRQFHNALEQVGFALGLELPDSEHRSFLNQLGLALEAELSAERIPDIPIAAWRQPLRFTEHQFGWEQRMGSAQALFGERLGEYRLCVRFADAVFVSKLFPVTSSSACVEAARDAVQQDTHLRDITLTAVNHHGAAVPLDLVVEDFRQINVSLVLDAPQPEPLVDEVELTLSLVLRQRTATIHTQRRNISVKPGRQRFQESLNLTPQLFEAGPGKYHLELFLGDRLLSPHISSE